MVVFQVNYKVLNENINWVKWPGVFDIKSKISTNECSHCIYQQITAIKYKPLSNNEVLDTAVSKKCGNVRKVLGHFLYLFIQITLHLEWKMKIIIVIIMTNLKFRHVAPNIV